MQDGQAHVRLDGDLVWSLGAYQFEDDTPFLLARYFYVKEDPAAICSPMFSTSNVSHASLTHTQLFRRHNAVCELLQIEMVSQHKSTDIQIAVNEFLGSTTIQWDGGVLEIRLRSEAAGRKLTWGFSMMFHGVQPFFNLNWQRELLKTVCYSNDSTKV